MTDISPKPCPFCGGEASCIEAYHNGDKVQSYYCDNDDCEIEPATGGIRGVDTLTIWNTRPIEDAQTAAIERLRQLVQQNEDATMATKKLKTLAEHNAEVISGTVPLRSSIPNGIACPKCGSEMLDTEPGVLMVSNPPQKIVHCDNCGYRGAAMA